MKTFITKHLTFGLILFSVHLVSAQENIQSELKLNQDPNLPDTIGVVIVSEDTIATNVKTIIEEVPAEQLDLRLFKNIDVDSLIQQKSDLNMYLKEISALEDVIKLNYKELNKQYDFIRNEVKLIDADYKLLGQKKKILKTDEKLLQQEKKLRDKEIKAFKSERKDFDKMAKNMNQEEKDVRLLRFMDNEARIEKAKNEWLKKQETLKSNYNLISQNEAKITRRDVDITNRYKELDRYKASLKLKQQQLSLEKKQVELEVKKAKLDMKVANPK